MGNVMSITTIIHGTEIRDTIQGEIGMVAYKEGDGEVTSITGRLIGTPDINDLQLLVQAMSAMATSRLIERRIPPQVIHSLLVDSVLEGIAEAVDRKLSETIEGWDDLIERMKKGDVTAFLEAFSKVYFL